MQNFSYIKKFNKKTIDDTRDEIQKKINPLRSKIQGLFPGYYENKFDSLTFDENRGTIRNITHQEITPISDEKQKRLEKIVITSLVEVVEILKGLKSQLSSSGISHLTKRKVNSFINQIKIDQEKKSVSIRMNESEVKDGVATGNTAKKTSDVVINNTVKLLSLLRIVIRVIDNVLLGIEINWIDSALERVSSEE